MGKVRTALLRALGNLREPRIWAYMLAPALFSFLLWVVLAFWSLHSVVTWLLDRPPMTWLANWGVHWLAHLLAHFGGWAVIFAGAYLTASMLAAIFVMPVLVSHVSKRQYSDVEAMGEDSFVAATMNSVTATGLFVLGWLLTVPLWLIPGMALILPLLLTGWFNRRTFAYDALSVHATDDEWKNLRKQEKRPMFLLGLAVALLAYVPFIGLVVPTFAALAFVHMGLEALRNSRGSAIVAIKGEAV